MFEITEAAIAWLVENRASKRIPASFGVRIFVDPERGGLSVRSAAEPREHEEAIERQGLRFFVGPETARRLAGRRIDVGQGGSGSGLLLRHEKKLVPSGAAAEAARGA